MTGIFINTKTLEYPRHPGDIELDPEGSYAEVMWVDPPEIDTTTYRFYELPPILENGVWTMAWGIREATPEEISSVNTPIL